MPGKDVTALQHTDLIILNRDFLIGYTVNVRRLFLVYRDLFYLVREYWYQLVLVRWLQNLRRFEHQLI